MGRGGVSKINSAKDRKQDRMIHKAKKKALIAKVENSLGAQGFNDLQGMTWGQKVNFVLISSWIFNTWYEKMGLLLFTFLGCWKILNFFGLF